MKKIYKYPLKIEDVQVIKLPVDSRIISVINQGGKLVLYAIVETEQTEVEDTPIYIFGTGYEVMFEWCLQHISTVSMADGHIVWHIFKIE